MRARIALLLLLAACSGIRPYPTGSSGNLAVRERTDGGVNAALHVHRIDAQCRTDYQGTVSLDAPSVTIDLPPGETSYLVVEFDTSSFFAGSRSTSFGTLINPRPGAHYALDVRYRESIYDVALTETDARTGQRRPLPRGDLSACRPRR